MFNNFVRGTEFFLKNSLKTMLWKVRLVKPNSHCPPHLIWTVLWFCLWQWLLVIIENEHIGCNQGRTWPSCFVFEQGWGKGQDMQSDTIWFQILE